MSICDLISWFSLCLPFIPAELCKLSCVVYDEMSFPRVRRKGDMKVVQWGFFILQIGELSPEMVNEVLLGLTNTDLWEGSLINMKEGSCSSIRHAVQKSCAAICNDLLVFHVRTDCLCAWRWLSRERGLPERTEPTTALSSCFRVVVLLRKYLGCFSALQGTFLPIFRGQRCYKLSAKHSTFWDFPRWLEAKWWTFQNDIFINAFKK